MKWRGELGRVNVVDFNLRERGRRRYSLKLADVWLDAAQ